MLIEDERGFRLLIREPHRPRTELEMMRLRVTSREHIRVVEGIVRTSRN